MFYTLLCIYLIVINVISFLITIIDKYNAKKGKWRIKENTLLYIAMLGGSVIMYFTMRIIRHKTLHNKFMIGLPCIILAQSATIIVFLANFF